MTNTRVEAGETDLLEGKPRSVKTGRTVEDVAGSEVKIRRESRSRIAPTMGSDPRHNGSARSRRAAAEGSDPIPVPRAKPGALPSFVEPQLASLAGHPPLGDAWVHEIKFDGYRLLARIDRGRVTLKTRSGLDWTAKFPSLKKALEALPVVTAFLDGEVTVETEGGTPDFGALQADLSEGRSDRFHYYLFDLMHLDGSDLTGAPLLDRKAALARLLAGHDGGPLKYSEHFTERGEVVLRHACRLGLEGIVSKLGNAPYRSGRSKAWLKSKCVDSDEFVIIGYVPSTTQRRVVGSLVLGYFDKGKLVYAGRVGSGFSTSVAEDLWRRLEAIRVDVPALAAPPPADVRRNVRWTKPSLVAEVELRGWTADGIVRHAVFKGLRQDKPAADVAPEKPAMTRKTSRRTTARSPFAHPSRPRAVARRGRDQAGSRRVLRRDLAVDRAACGRPAAGAGALSRRHRGRPASSRSMPGRASASTSSASRDPEGGEELLTIKDVEGLVSLVQASVLEIHVWGAKLGDIEKPDGITFDLDPDAGGRLDATWSTPPSRCATG